MLEKGKVKLFGQNGFSFMTYKEGDIFGDSDALLGELRDCKAAASSHSTLHSVKMEQVEDLFALFPDVHSKMKKLARAKRAKQARKIAQAEKKFPMYGL
jgi:signal-transduction protein with cAMP-binding, CBS, and nucleotidyltransferase domain